MLPHTIPHHTGVPLAQEMAMRDRQPNKVVAAWYETGSTSLAFVHSHPFHELVLVLGGDALYSANGMLYRVHPGDVLYSPAGCYHIGRFRDPQTKGRRLVLQIDDGLWRTAAGYSNLCLPDWEKRAAVLRAEGVEAWDLGGLFTRMWQVQATDASRTDALNLCQLTELHILVSQMAADGAVAEPAAASDLVARAEVYLHAHYTDPELTVAQAAQYVYVSREHLSRAFKEYTTESVHRYLTDLRMQHCRRAISSGASILEASATSGFSNYSSFLRTFRSLYGMTPAEYRAQIGRQF
ncbi:MAG: helix-turn-helix domain-containing protein [Gemmiger sp.]